MLPPNLPSLKGGGNELTLGILQHGRSPLGLGGHGSGNTIKRFVIMTLDSSHGINSSSSIELALVLKDSTLQITLGGAETTQRDSLNVIQKGLRIGNRALNRRKQRVPPSACETCRDSLSEASTSGPGRDPPGTDLRRPPRRITGGPVLVKGPSPVLAWQGPVNLP